MRKILILIEAAIIIASKLILAQTSFTAKTDFTLGTRPHSVSFSDLNGDGLDDMAVVNASSATISVLLNQTLPGNSTPSFTTKTDYATGNLPVDSKIRDLNGDGKPDLVVVNNSSNTISIFLNTTITGANAPSFTAKTDFATGSMPSNLSIDDLNGDGKPDLAVTNYGENSVSIYLNTTTLGATTPSFTLKTDFGTGSAPWGVTTRDFNCDGISDLAVTNYTANTFSVLMNNTTPGASTPSFTAKTDFTTGGYPICATAVELNGDGKADVVIANFNGFISAFINTTTPGTTNPTFTAKTDITVGAGPYNIYASELNGDGKIDLIVANHNSSSISVLVNTTAPGTNTPTFLTKIDYPVGGNPRAVSSSDINCDGKPDIAVANYWSNTVSILMNNSAIGVSTPILVLNEDEFITGASPYSLALDDINGDGLTDIAVANTGNNYVSVLLNTTAPGANTFTFTASTDFLTGSQPRSVALGDLNGDGKPDMVVANSGSISISVFLNTTATGAAVPSFASSTNYQTGFGPYSVSLNDFNGDVKLDLAVANFSDNSVTVYINNTNPGASTPNFISRRDFSAGNNPRFVSGGDLNGDGMADMVVANAGTPATLSVYYNRTDPGETVATFTAKTDFGTGSNPHCVAIGDLNGDGKPDLGAANYSSNTLSLLINTTVPGSNTPSYTEKTDFTTGNGTSFITFGDINGDFKPDVITADYSFYALSLFMNTTEPGTTTPSLTARTEILPGGQPNATAIRDLNGDGKPDIVVADQSSSTVLILRNNTDYPLPVELNFFTADVKNNLVKLKWQTETEVNNYGFKIERKANKDWEKIGFIKGNGNSNAPKYYSYDDENPTGGKKLQYRLKQIDNDGQFEYSEIINVELAIKNYALHQNYPNPFNPSTLIEFSLPEDVANVKLSIYNALGEKVAELVNTSLQAGRYQYQWNAQNVATGMYIYELRTDKFVSVKKMILIK